MPCDGHAQIETKLEKEGGYERIVKGPSAPLLIVAPTTDEEHRLQRLEYEQYHAQDRTLPPVRLVELCNAFFTRDLSTKCGRFFCVLLNDPPVDGMEKENGEPGDDEDAKDPDAVLDLTAALTAAEKLLAAGLPLAHKFMYAFHGYYL